MDSPQKFEDKPLNAAEISNFPLPAADKKHHLYIQIQSTSTNQG